MTKFNKSLLTAAVVGALALPGLASAATLSYATGQQITYAKDLFVNDTISIETPADLQLIAQAVDDNTGRITSIAAGEVLTVKVTLANGAQFDSTAPAATLVATFLEGAQTGGAGAPINVVPGSENYNGSELNFKYTTTGAGTIGAAGDYFLQLNSAKVKNLIQGLFNGSQVNAEITVQNGDGQQVLAAKTVLAKSAWGVTVRSNPEGIVDPLTGLALAPGDLTKTIDVGADPRKTLFSTFGVVGAADSDVFNAGGFNVDITRALETAGVGANPPGTYINNFNATALDPEYNIVNTATFTVKVSGSDLGVFAGANAWLDASPACDKVGGAGTFVNAAAALDGGALVFTSATTSALWNSVTAAPPIAPGANLYVCLQAHDDVEINPQALSGTVALDYDLPTQRVNPAPWNISLLPLRLNGTTLIFQNVNPGGNSTAQSFLRLTNNNAQVCPVVIDAKDDAGLLSDQVTLTLQPHASIQLNSDELENGSSKAAGSFGDGTGKWYVRVTAECSNFKASALNRHQDGVVTNLTPEKWDGEEWLTPTSQLNP